MRYDVVCLRPEADFLRAGVTPPESLTIAYRALDDLELPALMATTRALVISAVGPKLPGPLFQDSVLKLAQVTGAGVDRLDQPTLKRLGIPVCNVPGGSNIAVADYAVTTASVLLRRLAWADAEIRAGNYVKFRAHMLADNPSGLDGLTVGVVGLGTIGLAVAEAFHNRGCALVYFDPTPRDPGAAAALGARSVSLDELLRTSDIVTLHVPLLPATKGLIGASQLDLMKPDAVLIQVARGGIVDETALAAHLESGRLGGAAVDVYSTEPPDATNSLFALKGDAARRMLFTPHVAGITRQSTAVLFGSAWENVARVLLHGEAPLNRVF
jgi:phosphoglycerate dehydrogenase-like enzyme